MSSALADKQKRLAEMAEVLGEAMKLSVSAFRAQATAQRKILKPYQNQLNYGSCSSFPMSGIKVDEVPHMMVDKTGIGPPKKPGDQSQSSENSAVSSQDEEEETMIDGKEESKTEPDISQGRGDDFSKSPGGTRTKSNQRWMKLRTTVQLSGAISNTIQKSKPPLKREDSFLKRFSTRQIPETQETVDTGDETETANGGQSQEEVNRRRRKRRKEQSQTVVNPDENFYFYWLMTVTVCVLYNLWTLIVRQSFPELQRDSSSFWYACDGLTDIIFVCDIVVQFRTGYLEQGLMVYDSKKLAKHYLKSRAFVFDLLALLPLDLLQIEIGANPIIRFPRFLKIYRAYNYYYIVESRTVYPNLWRVVNLIHILLILAHWFGCFYYLLSEAEGFQGAWVYPFRQGDDATLTRKYLGSLYWSTLTLTTIGDLPTPETNAESRIPGCSKAMTCEDSRHPLRRRGHKSRLLQINSSYGYIFTIVSYLIGVFIFATIVGQVGNVITNRNANRLEFERLLDGAKTYMRHHKVPGGMKRRVLRWYDYSWSRGRIQGGGDINTALGLLPDKLKTELALHVNLSVLKKVTIFQECQPEFLHDLVLKMKAYIFTPGDLICRKGEIAREMFIIADGILDVISETGRVLTTMKAGDFFGEIGILNLDGLNKRTADVRSVGYSELFSLSREDVLTAMKDYPEAQEILQNLGRKRLMEARNACKIQKSQVRQIKEHLESPGESDNAGKRIVEKLRSDVKGLKIALKRTRRETQDEIECDGHRGSNPIKSQNGKQSILRRMSHVQSSDEYDASNEGGTPIGAGLPLLQRLKLLKEKQDRENEKKSKALIMPRRDNTDAEATPRLVAVKEKDDFEEMSSEDAAVTPPPRDIRATAPLYSPPKQTLPDPEKGHKEGETQPMQPLNDRLKPDGASDETNKISMSKPAQKYELPKILSQELNNHSNQETSIYVPKAKGNVVPNQALGGKLEVPKTKERWNMLGISVKDRKGDESRHTSLSGDDATEAGKLKIGGIGIEKRSRSMSPSDEAKYRKRTFLTTVEHLIRERRRSRSLSGEDQKIRRATSPSGSGGFSRSTGANPPGDRIKKYNSIDDLSPEYSGLPFVKKLKILNERQKLAELVEKEIVVRSASLDVPERTSPADLLIRSESVTSTIDTQLDQSILNRAAGERERKTSFLRSRPFRSEDSFRAAMMDMKQRFASTGSSSSLQSPESNETIERRHLKSILKKLSADDDSGPDARSKRSFSVVRSGKAELKKLMRAPTVEGYAARHTKLTKSVTFDRETSQGPTDAITSDTNLMENTGGSLTSPAAILALQPFGLSRMPPASATVPVEEACLRSPEMVAKVEEELKRLLGYNRWPSDRENLPISPYAKITNGIIEIVQGHLDDVRGRIRATLQDIQSEVKKRDEIIHELKARIEELENRSPRWETGRAEKARRETLKRGELNGGSPSGLGQGSRGCSPNFGRDFRSSAEEAAFDPFQRLNMDSFRISETDENESVNSESDTFPNESNEDGARAERHRNGSQETESKEVPRRLARLRKEFSLERERRVQKQKSDSKSKGFLAGRKPEQRSSDFVSVDIEDDEEESEINDWEVKMLAEELSKKHEWDSEKLEEVKKLEDDVNALKRVVCEGNLTCFTSSELDMLEAILDAKDEKISEIASSSSCFELSGREWKPRAGTSGKPRRLGQALSFDFYDVKEPSRKKCSFPLEKQRSISGVHGERQSLENLVHLGFKNRAIEGETSSSKKSRSSLPHIVCDSTPEGSRKSFAELLKKDFHRVKECSTSSSDESDAKESYDSVFEESRSETEKLRGRSSGKPSSSSSDGGGGGGGINNFIRTVRQRVRHAVAGEGARDQVPTISKICESRGESPEEILPADTSLESLKESELPEP